MGQEANNQIAEAEKPTGGAAHAAGLEEFSAFFGTIADMAGLGLWIYEPQAGRVEFSPQWEALAGGAAGSLPGTFSAWEEALLPQDLPRAKQTIARCLAGTGPTCEMEYRLKRPDGTLLWVRDKGTAAGRDENGTPTRLLFVTQDISGAKKTEATLLDTREDKQFSDAMFNANPYINLIFDDALHLMDCNPAAIDYFGFASRGDLLENLLPLIAGSIPEFQPDGSPSVPLQDRFDYVVAHGFMEFELEMVLQGRRVPMRFTLKKIAHRDTFAIAGYLVDMHSLKEARNDLMRQDFLMRQVNRAATRLMSADPAAFDETVLRVLKSLGQGVKASRMFIWQNYSRVGQPCSRALYLWNSDDENEKANPAAEALDYTRAPQWYDRLHAKKSLNLRVRELADDQRTLLGAGRSKVVLLLPIFLQEEFWGVVGLHKNTDDTLFTGAEEKVVHSAGILAVSAIVNNNINRSLIQAREAALASDMAKTEFLSRMSHEIRTPMNAIIGMTAIAKKSQDPARVRSSLDKIEAASGKLLQIINDILDMSKIESGKLDITAEPFDLEKTIENVMDVAKVRLDEKQQHFTLYLQKVFDRFIVCDELRLSQVIINLLTNAAKFSPEGGDISLSIGYAQKQGPVFTLRGEVQDNGIGISKQQQAKLFRSFEQADGSITRRFGGTGLGLAICKSITGLMGGDVWVESEEDKGATFIFEVEFTWGQPLDEDTPLACHPTAAHCWAGKQVLVVEDVAINREILQSLLEETAVRLTCAENGQVAVELFAREPDKYDLILMDVQMPVMDGLAATEKIRLMPVPAAKMVPILAMTANAFTEDVNRCLAAGMNGHIAKPIDVDEMLRKIAFYLDE